MNGRRLALLVLLLLVAAGALWTWRSGQDGETTPGGAAPPQQAYDYEAHDVVLRQMGPDGRLQFQVEARQITQLPESGRIAAEGLTLYHDPPGTEPGGPNRWTLTADRGELPAEGGVVTLDGNVRARGIPVGGRSPVTFAAARLQYDMTTQELCSKDEVQLTLGSSIARVQGLCFNVATNKMSGSEIDAIVVPR
jgi:LPS export ABC transporter protein LptC